MKNIFTLFLLVIVLFSNALFAQEVSKEMTTEPRHVGVDNYYKLGTKNNPVTANEYCAFLNSDHNALDSFQGSAESFYDATFMRYDYPTSLLSWSGHSSLKKNDCITRYYLGRSEEEDNLFSYSVVDGRGDYIIDGLSYWYSGGGYAHVVANFKEWRKNPTVEEICTSLNASLEGSKENFEGLEEKYPSKTAHLNLIRDLVLLLSDKRRSTVRIEGLALYDEQNRTLITFVKGKGGLRALLTEGANYYRPKAYF